MKNLRLGRRTVLQGLGAAIALPTLEAMLTNNGDAYAQTNAPLPRRMVIFFYGNGVVLNRYRPSATGSGYALTEALAPLGPVKDYLNVVSGYMVKTPNLRGHHNGVAGMLSGYPFIPLPAGNANYSSKFGGPSVDQVAAPLIKGGTQFPSLELAVSKRVTTGEGPTLQYIAHKGPDQPLSPTFNPATVFNTLFASFTPKDPTDPRDRLRVSVLDAVKDDATRLRTRLGKGDRERMDAHLTGISELRGQILALPPVVTSSCVKPDPAITQQNNDINGKEQLRLVGDLMSDLTALAFACDLTRVVTIQFTSSVGGQVFSDIGQVDNQHAVTHDAARQGEVHDSVVFTMERFSHLIQKLKSSVEGTGNVLDNTVAMATSDVSQGVDHSINDYPVILAGKAGGYLKYPGVHFRGSLNPNASDILLTMLRAVGANVASVGKDAGYSTTECAGIKA